jgi:pimeloyl-ACP methyl ester carboxylesterase
MHKTFQYQEATISYRVEGKGNPVVLIHGFGEDSHIWDTQTEFLKEHFLLILPNLPGTGNSQMIVHSIQEKNNVTPFSSVISIDDYADCIYTLLLHENIKLCTMLGHSMGGYITLAFAQFYPQMLVGFGLIHSSALADSEEKKANRQTGIETMNQGGAYAFFKNSIPSLFASFFKETNPGKINELVEATKYFSTKACQQYLNAMINRPDRTEVLEKTPLPVLFIIGTEDAAAPMKDVLKQTRLPKSAVIHILEKTGHMSMLETPGLLNQYLFAFINR